MFQIVIFHRAEGKARAHLYESRDLAVAAANEVFKATGVVLGIEEVTQ